MNVATIDANDAAGRRADAIRAVVGDHRVTNSNDASGSVGQDPVVGAAGEVAVFGNQTRVDLGVGCGAVTSERTVNESSPDLANRGAGDGSR